MNKKLTLLNIEINNIYQKDLLDNFSEGFFMPINVDLLVKLQKDREFYEVYQSADWVVCDSKVIALCLKFLGISLKEVIAGSSFFPDYYNYHKDNEQIKIFLLGAAEGVAQKAMQKINERVDRKIVIGAYSPSFGFEKSEEECERIVQIINSSGANVLAVGVGAPKQEKWIHKYRNQLNNINSFMALGATIDFESGNKKRAPKKIRDLSLEWFYRMCMEPRRLLKRYLIDDLPFFSYLIKQKLGLYKNPFEK